MRAMEGTGGQLRWVNGETREKESTVLGQPGEVLLIASLLYSHTPMLILNKGPFLTGSENVSWGSCLTITRDVVDFTCPVVWGIQQTSEGPWAHSIKHHLPTTLSKALAVLTAICSPSPTPLVYRVGDGRCFHTKCHIFSPNDRSSPPSVRPHFK